MTDAPVNEMLERVARSIGKARGHLFNEEYPYLPSDMVYARAAIAAMREPTDAMCRAAHSESQRGGFEPVQTWLFMIDEVLK